MVVPIVAGVAAGQIAEFSWPHLALAYCVALDLAHWKMSVQRRHHKCEG